jgi:hypothetical protein
LLAGAGGPSGAALIPFAAGGAAILLLDGNRRPGTPGSGTGRPPDQGGGPGPGKDPGDDGGDGGNLPDPPPPPDISPHCATSCAAKRGSRAPLRFWAESCCCLPRR